MMGAEQLVELYHNERGALKRSVARVVDEHRAEDLVHDAFLTFIARSPAADRPAAWLWKVARNRSLNELRRRRHELPLDDDRIASEPARIASFPAERDAVRAVLEEALATLPERARIALRGRYLEGLSYEEIARALGVRVEQAHVVVHRSVRRLGKHLVRTFAASHGALSCVPALEALFLGGGEHTRGRPGRAGHGAALGSAGRIRAVGETERAGEHDRGPCRKCRPAWDELAALRSLGLTAPGGLLPVWLRRFFTELPARIPGLSEVGSGLATALVVLGLSAPSTLGSEPRAVAPARVSAVSVGSQPTTTNRPEEPRARRERKLSERRERILAPTKTREEEAPAPLAEAGPVRASTGDTHTALEADGDEGTEGGVLVCRPLEPCPPPPSP